MSVNRRMKIGEMIVEYLEWAEATFPNESQEDIMAHIKEELSEIEQDPTNAFEHADALMLMLYMAHRNGGIWQAFQQKLEINKARKWVKTDKGIRHEK